MQRAEPNRKFTKQHAEIKGNNHAKSLPRHPRVAHRQHPQHTPRKDRTVPLPHRRPSDIGQVLRQPPQQGRRPRGIQSLLLRQRHYLHRIPPLTSAYISNSHGRKPDTRADATDWTQSRNRRFHKLANRRSCPSLRPGRTSPGRLPQIHTVVPILLQRWIAEKPPKQIQSIPIKIGTPAHTFTHHAVETRTIPRRRSRKHNHTSVVTLHRNIVRKPAVRTRLPPESRAASNS